MLKMKLIIFGFVLLSLLLIGCNTIVNDEIKLGSQDNFDKNQTPESPVYEIPDGYVIIDTFLYDFNRDSSLECLLHCSTKDHVPCGINTYDNCYADKLILLHKKKKWSIDQQFDIPQPLINDSNSVNVNISENGGLVISQHFRPTGYSGVTRKQYYRLSDSTLLLDSLYEETHTKSGMELYSWFYNFNYVNNQLHFRSTYLDMSSEEEENSGRSTDSIIEFNFARLPTIEQSIKLEEIILQGIETPWY